MDDKIELGSPLPINSEYSEELNFIYGSPDTWGYIEEAYSPKLYRFDYLWSELCLPGEIFNMENNAVYEASK